MFIDKSGVILDAEQPNLVSDFRCPPGSLFDPGLRELLGVVVVADPVAPEVNETQKVELIRFDFVGEPFPTWSPVWSITDKTQGELDAEASALEQAKAAAIAKCYPDVDAVTTLAVGNRTEEYRVAEEAARAFAQSGYAGNPGLDVSAYAQYNPTGVEQTNQWAADQIIARADAMRTALTNMRAKRFECQAKMRTASTPDDLAAVVSTWNQFIAGTRSALGV